MIQSSLLKKQCQENFNTSLIKSDSRYFEISSPGSVVPLFSDLNGSCGPHSGGEANIYTHTHRSALSVFSQCPHMFLLLEDRLTNFFLFFNLDKKILDTVQTMMNDTSMFKISCHVDIVNRTINSIHRKIINLYGFICVSIFRHTCIDKEQ